jgi:tRNA (guanine37-N1)-methyltransferase
MDFAALTIFPEMFDHFWEHGIIQKAVEQGKIAVSSINIRDFAQGRHRTTDDRPFGGGDGMVMKPEPLAGAIRHAEKIAENARKILLTPQGRPFNQQMARKFCREKGLILICGRYEGVDERIYDDLIDEEVSIGDYVLMGGELAAMVIIEAVTRLLPGILGGEESAQKDSFTDNLLEHAHYTRPRIFEGSEVPDVLLSGHHEKIDRWRKESAIIRTFLKRRDLLQDRLLDNREIEILKKWRLDIEHILHAQTVCGADALPGDE